MLSDQQYDQLCRQVQIQDPSCITDLYDSYGNALYGVILRIVRNENAASELLQDTFTKIWAKGNTFNPGKGRLYTWMMRIARNLALNYIASKSKRDQENIQGDENLVHISDGSRGMEAMESFDLKGAVSRIELKYQDVIQLIYFQGFTHKEASDELKLPVGTVKSRIKIALRELKKIYEFRVSNVILTLILIFSVSI